MSNPFFNNRYTPNNNEFELYRAASNELVEIHGVDFKYITKEHVNQDFIFGEDNNKSFNSFKYVTMLIENYESFEGVDDMFSKFGFQVDNKLTLLVERNKFLEIVGKEPEIDDLVYHEHSTKIFQIKHLPKHDGFYQMQGGKVMFRLICEIFTPSHETFNTNIDEVDILNTLEKSDNDKENDQFESEKEDILNFDESDIFNNL